MNHQQPSALGSTPVVCPAPLTSQELLDIRAALTKWTETSLPEESLKNQRLGGTSLPSRVALALEKNRYMAAPMTRLNTIKSSHLKSRR
jgi:hypothetical protein